jgi:hypothetical protein
MVMCVRLLDLASKFMANKFTKVKQGQTVSYKTAVAFRQLLTIKFDLVLVYNL